MIVYLATGNAGKVREMEALYQDAPFSLAAYAAYEAPVEGDASYAANAALKAHALHAQLRRAGRPGHVLADDSGLEVVALDGRPGVLTAYYGGVDASWAERRRALLAEIAATGSDDRRARFVCALHFVAADGREFATMATVDGLVPLEERGELGFSFDAVFLYEPAGRTFAEMPAEDKNAVSHRAIAAAGLLAALRQAGVPSTSGDDARDRPARLG